MARNTGSLKNRLQTCIQFFWTFCILSKNILIRLHAGISLAQQYVVSCRTRQWVQCRSYTDTTTICQISLAATYHDIGKIKIPLSILDKPGRLTDSEYTEIKKHAVYGSDMMKNLFVPEVCNMILYHHENMDGSGYYGLNGDNIPLGSRIIHICDVYDALISDRPYRNGWSKAKAVAYMREQSDKMFDAAILDVFLDILA